MSHYWCSAGLKSGALSSGLGFDLTLDNSNIYTSALCHVVGLEGADKGE